MLEVEQGSPEWRAARMGKATASRISDIMAKGRSGQPSATRANYLADLVTERLTGVPNEGFTSPAMQHGVDTEAEAREAYAFETGLTVATVGFAPHPTIAMSGASPDALVGDDGLAQFKCPNTATHIKTLLGGSIERAYLLQMQWEMACAGRSWCDFVSYDNRLPLPMRLFRRRIERDAALIDEIATAVLDFLADVEATEHALRSQYLEAA